MSFNNLLNKIMSNPGSSAAAGGFAGGMLSNMLMRRGGMGRMVGYGGLAALGVMAYQAYKKNQGDSTQASSPEQVQQEAQQAAFLPPPNSEAEGTLGRHLVEAMISAAKADGNIDSDEHQKITQELNNLELSAEDKAYLFDCMNKPAEPERIAALAGSPQEASELYLASLLAIEDDHWAEQAYLGALKNALKLDDGLAKELEQSIKQA